MQKSKWQRMAAVAAVGTLFAFTAACGDDDDDGDTAASTTVGSADETTTTEGEAPADDDGLADLVAAAQEEGQLTFYCSPPELDCVRIADAFEGAYDISTEFINISGPEIAQRFAAEATAGAVVADALVISSTSFLDTAVADGSIVPLDDADIPGWPGDFPDDFILADQGVAMMYVQPLGIGINTDIVEEGAIDDWEDLLDPAYEGQILLGDPALSDLYIYLYDALAQEYGDEFLTQLKEQDARIVAGGAVPAVEALGAGEAAIFAPAVQSVIGTAADRGAPVAQVQPDLATGVQFVVALAADAPHSAAGRLFAHFALSEDGNAEVADGPGLASPFGGGGLPADFRQGRPEAVQEARKAEIISLLGF